MQRVRLTPSASVAALCGLAFFAVALLAIGLAVALGARRIHAARPDTSMPGLVIGGAVIALVGVLVARAAARNGRAVAMIDVGEDGAWTLRRALGGAVGRVEPQERRELLLGGYNVIVARPTAVRRQEAVAGTLVLDGVRRYRLISAGRDAYDRALASLGYPERAPRPGLRLEIPPHAFSPVGPRRVS